jgi:signal transduction histidine kinase
VTHDIETHLPCPALAPQALGAPSQAQDSFAAMSRDQLWIYARDLGRTLAEREASYGQLRAYVLDLHRVLAERDSARKAAKCADATKKQLLSNMSHEFRTPLTAILGFSDYLREREADPEKRDLMQRVARAARRIEGLADKLLTLARLEFGALAAEPALCDCVHLVREAAGRHEAAAQAKSIAFSVRVPEFSVLPVVIDGALLAQALGLVVDNAVKFTRQGSVRVELVSDPSSGLPLRVEVADTGPGIGEGFRPRIFGAFEQEDGSSTRPHDGAGIGLATAAGLVDLIGGQLHYRSTPGAGSTFVIEFPHALPGDRPAAPPTAPASLN